MQASIGTEIFVAQFTEDTMISNDEHFLMEVVHHNQLHQRLIYKEVSGLLMSFSYST